MRDSNGKVEFNWKHAGRALHAPPSEAADETMEVGK
jgi:hypothetical protein